MKFLQLSSIAFVSFFLTFFNDIQTLFSLNSLLKNPKSLIHLSPVLAQSSTDKKAEADRLLNQGVQQVQSSQIREAIQSWQQSLKLYREIGDRQREAASLMLLGSAYSNVREYQKAIQFFEQSIPILQEIENRNALKLTLISLGSAYESLGKYQKAIEFYQQSLVIAQEIGDLNGVATSLNGLGSAYESLREYQKAISFLQESLSIFQQIDDRDGIASSLNNLGIAYKSQGEYQKAIEFFEQSLSIFQGIDDRNGVANSLMNLGIAYESLGQYQKAIELYQQSLSIFQQISDINGTANSLGNLGNAYLNRGEYQKAIEFFEQSLSIFQQIGDLNSVASSLNGLGTAYFSRGEYQKAIELYQQSLSIFQQIGNHNGVASSLMSLGTAYRGLGQYQKAIEFYQQSLSIQQEIGDLNGVAKSLLGLGNAYWNLGEYQKAIEFNQQSLSIFQQIGDRNGITDSLSNLGNVYWSLGEYQKAIEFSQQSLPIQKEIGDLNGEANSLGNLGNAYWSLGEYQKAIEFYQQSLSIKQEIGDLNGVASLLNNLGNPYWSLGEYQKAIEFYQQSLSIQQEIGDRNGAAISLNNIGYLLSQQNQPELAIVFYKQSVNVTESIRQDIRGLDRDLQQSYLETVAGSYRSLADLLLQQDRILEAQQVIDLLKVQELEDYLKNVRGNAQTQQGLELLPAERQLWTQYNALQEKAIPINQELTQLRKIPLNDRTPAQQQRIGELVNKEQEMKAIFKEFLASPAIQKLVQTLSRITDNENINLRSYLILQKSLANLQQNAVILYPLILEDRLELILVTPQTAAPIRRVVNVKRDVLNQAILDYRNGLKQDASDPETFQKKAQTLYDYLIKPLEKDLADLKTETLIYAPDGQLRYVPLAGLYDGQQWLIQKYRINNITASSLTDFTLKPRHQPLVLAGGFSDQQAQYKFKIGDREFDFNGLEFADDEVNNIAATIPNTKALLNRDFNRNQTEVNMGDYNILHFATHGAFVVGQPEDSFVLFGDGDRASLRDMGTWDLQNVDLVVFSACQTALGNQLGANGEEILGLGYTIQRQGATATVATLWTVDDASTQQLMNIFYQELQQGKSISEALRQAQIALITGKASHPNADKNITQPYYWAAFIIIGNGF